MKKILFIAGLFLLFCAGSYASSKQGQKKEVTMKEKFLNDSINLITRYNNTYTEDDIDKIKYGLEGLYLTVTKLIIIVLIRGKKN